MPYVFDDDKTKLFIKSAEIVSRNTSKITISSGESKQLTFDMPPNMFLLLSVRLIKDMIFKVGSASEADYSKILFSNVYPWYSNKTKIGITVANNNNYDVEILGSGVNKPTVEVVYLDRNE
jgi:hypothetical protein